MNDLLTIVGNIASDPQHTITPSGVSILNFRLASNHRRFDNKTGQWVESDPNWYSVSAFRRLADNGKLSLARGDSVIVSGKLRVRDWESNGRRGTSVDLEADTIGPDLRFGTVRYARSRSERSADDQNENDEASDSAAHTDDDAWAVPRSDDNVPLALDTTQDAAGGERELAEVPF
ncbi:single-stranded DNA-binding protein [Microbacterium keratanolyticum]|uniref:single-stranded DNA-binding protein n=1 Tax=Microbacterium keratanolyticum TaxID=67574 RepID=UPI0036276DAE